MICVSPNLGLGFGQNIAPFRHPHHQTNVFIGSWQKSQRYTNVICTSSCSLSSTFRKVLESQNELSRCLHSTHPTSDLTLWIFGERVISPGGLIYSRCGDAVYLRTQNVEEESLRDMHRRRQRAKLIPGLKVLVFYCFSWCEIQFKFALNA